MKLKPAGKRAGHLANATEDWRRAAGRSRAGRAEACADHYFVLFPQRRRRSARRHTLPCSRSGHNNPVPLRPRRLLRQGTHTAFLCLRFGFGAATCLRAYIYIGDDKKRFIGSIMVTHTHYSLNNSSVIPPFVSKCNSADYPPPRSFTLIISIVVVRSSKTTISPLPTSIAWVFLTLKR